MKRGSDDDGSNGGLERLQRRNIVRRARSLSLDSLVKDDGLTGGDHEENLSAQSESASFSASANLYEKSSGQVRLTMMRMIVTPAQDIQTCRRETTISAFLVTMNSMAESIWAIIESVN